MLYYCTMCSPTGALASTYALYRGCPSKKFICWVQGAATEVSSVSLVFFAVEMFAASHNLGVASSLNGLPCSHLFAISGESLLCGRNYFYCMVLIFLHSTKTTSSWVDFFPAKFFQRPNFISPTRTKFVLEAPAARSIFCCILYWVWRERRREMRWLRYRSWT